MLFWSVDSTQQCKYFHVFGRVRIPHLNNVDIFMYFHGDDALPSTAAHCAHPVRGRMARATCAHGASSVSTSGVRGAEAVGTCWMQHIIHTPPYVRHVPHHHAE